MEPDMAKVYVERCASAICSGGTPNSAYPLKHPEEYGIPAEISQAIAHDESICYCGWCRFVWRQPRAAKLGVDAIPLGYIEEADGQPVFRENRHVPIRDWKLN